MSTTEQKALALRLADRLEDLLHDWIVANDAAAELRRLFAEIEALSDQSDAFERKLAELVDLVSPGLDSGDLLDDATSACVQATALRAQVEALTGKPRETNLHDINAGIEVMAYLRESRAPHYIYSKMSSCLFGDPDRTDAHPTPSPLTRPAVDDQEIDRVINRLESDDPDFEDCSAAASLLTKLKSLTRPAVPDADDSLLLCISDLQHSAIYDNHVEMQECIRAVAERIKQLAAAPQPEAQPTEVDVAIPGWTESDALAILNRISDGPFGQADVDDALEFMRHVDDQRQMKILAAVDEAQPTEAAQKGGA